MAELFPAPRLAELREPPVVGKFYMVPFVRAVWHGREGDWPVMGAIHHDARHFHFLNLHYHVDPRFLTSKQVRLTRCDEDTRHGKWAHLFASPLSFDTPGVQRWTYNKVAPKGRPDEKWMRCARQMPPTVFHAQPAVLAMQADFGKPAKPVIRRDGRRLCPHRKFDLSTIAAGEDGLTVCPLHGLRVDCR